MKTVCNKHGSDIIVHEVSNVCPLCKAFAAQRGLVQLLLNAGALSELPEEHQWAVVSGTLQVAGPDWGMCLETCKHPPFDRILLPEVAEGALRVKQPKAD